MPDSSPAFIARKFPALVRVFVAGGFAMLFAELWIIGHWWGAQQVALAACAAGMAVTLASLLPSPKVKKLAAGLFFVVALLGALGFVMHLDRQGLPIAPQLPPPIFAPLSLSGLALLAALSIIAELAPTDRRP